MRFWTFGGFFSSVKGHVVKWWQLVILPTLRINNNGKNTKLEQQTEQPAQQAGSQETPISQVSQGTMTDNAQSIVQSENRETDTKDVQMNSASSEDPMEVLRRINEEKEAKQRKEIENAKQKASEEVRIAAIMNANKVDVNAFIEAGKAAKEEIAAKKAEEKKADDLRRAQEVMDRLNREAAEDEAKKQKEIEAAKQEAKKHFG